MVHKISRALRAPAGAAPLAALLLAGAAWPALAQSEPAAQPKPADTSDSASAPMTDDEDADTVAAVVVVGSRDKPQPGAVVGDIQPEIQLGPGDIQSYGVSSITDLLDELAPQLGSNRGRGGERPVVLLNGRRISGFREIRDIPTEAIMRVDILPEEAALAYGYSADQKVINFVLRRRFQAITAEASAGGPTAGGQATGSAELNHVRIRGDDRLNVVLKADMSTALTEDERGLDSTASAAEPYDLIGNLTSAVRGGEIDPALSALAGQTVTVAGLPASAAAGQGLTLSDLAATAGVANASDVSRYRTLKPKTQEVDGNLVFARTLPHDFRGTLTAGFTASHSEALRGLPGASLTISSDNAYSPFDQDVALNRYVDAFGPLKQTNDSWSAELGGALNRDIGKWRLSLTGDYEHDNSLTHSDVGVDISGLQSAVDAGDVSPFAAWPADLLVKAGRNKAQSVSDAFNVQAVGSGEAFQGPAGPIRTSFKVGEAASWLSSDTLRSGVETGADLSRNTLSAQGSVDVPIASRRHEFLPFLGELSLNANAAVNELSDFGTLTTVGFGAHWRPLTGVSFIVSHTTDEGAPSMAQLGGPLITTEAARIFDYSTGQTVEVRQLSGGNPDLISDKRNVTKIGLTLKPFSSQDLTLVANYVRARNDNPIATFPAATAEIEAAFPDRFLRNADGELVQVDYRPVNFARSSNDSLRWGLNYSRPFGPQPQRRFRRPPPEAGEGGPPPDEQPQRAGDASSSGERAQGAGQGGGQGGGPGGEDGGGPPPGGPPRGGPGFGPGGGGAGGRIQFAIYHTVTFKDQILVREGGPVFDLLHGSAAGDGGGQPRHEVEAQAGVSRNGLGARLSAKWQSATTVDAAAASATGDLHFSSLATVDLRLFANLGANRDLVQKYPWMRGSRVTFSVTNLLDEHQQVRDATGLTPVGYRPDELDPLGRVVKVSFRKLFF